MIIRMGGFYYANEYSSTPDSGGKVKNRALVGFDKIRVIALIDRTMSKKLLTISQMSLIR